MDFLLYERYITIIVIFHCWHFRQFHYNIAYNLDPMQIIQNTHFRTTYFLHPSHSLFLFLSSSLSLALQISILPRSAFAVLLLLSRYTLSSQSTTFISLGRQPNDCLPLVCFLISYLKFVFSPTFPKLLREVKRRDWLVTRFAIPFPRQQRQQQNRFYFEKMLILWRLRKLLINMLQTISHYINSSISIFCLTPVPFWFVPK